MSKLFQYFIKTTHTATLLGLLGVFSVTAQSANAGDGKDIAKKNQCMSCHKEEGKLVGPAFKDVAVKYKGDAAAIDRLAEKVRKGGKGAWGTMPMPPNSKISDGDLKTVITWIVNR